jgi:hypothetical protein
MHLPGVPSDQVEEIAAQMKRPEGTISLVVMASARSSATRSESSIFFGPFPLGAE